MSAVRGARWTLALLAAGPSAFGCGSAPPTARAVASPSIAARPFEERDRRGPLPAAQLDPNAHDLVALEVETGREPARQTALAFLRALLAADAVGLQQVFAEEVAYGVESAARPRAELVERCIGEARALRYGADTSPESVVDVDSIEVRRVASEDQQMARPPGILASDLIVTLPPHVASAGNPARVPCLHSLYVRIGEPTRVVGLIR